ncbi:MAG TPA: nuclear transport factor 2 family protein [Candidatus Didemnitutus sp.]|nr:nuclear transport factor 2 family protein [Candidatus Didemnitutus sp.]
MTETCDPWLQILDRYKTAVFDKDVEAFMAIHDDDLHVFDMWGRWSLRGAKAWREMATGWFSSLGNERVVVSANDAESTQNADLMIGHATLTFAAMSAEGKELRSLNNRLTAALRRSGGSWKIFHAHTSVPIEHQSLKGILRRETDGPARQ